jgi:ribonucleotide reductase beta subunit family protein with ferritin-like domain
MNRLPEPILTISNDRFTQFPIRYPAIQKAYETHEAMFWSAKEIDFTADLNDWNTLNEKEKYFIEMILGAFSQMDGIVLENLIQNFCCEVKIPEARNFYAFQGMIENIHAQTYGLMIETFVKDPQRKNQLFHAIDEIPCVQKKANWALKWFDGNRPFEERLIAFAALEGIFFSGSFCAIFWLKSQNKMTKALGKSNELIARDEGLHQTFAVLLYQHLNNKANQERAIEIINEAVTIEEEFICKSLPCNLLGMNNDLMREYIKYVADRLLVQFGFEKIYNAINPFDFMKTISLDGKTNFFEMKTTEYQHSSVANINSSNWDMDDVEF